MQKLVAGLHEFQQQIFSSKQQLFETLAEGQQPPKLFITCSDSRISPSLVTQTDPGELFVLRNADNIVPPFGAVDGGESATIEYAVTVLGVSEIIVCGHSHCGGMGPLLDLSQLNERTVVRSWLRHAESPRRIMDERNSQLTDPAAHLTTAVEENVLVQIENLKTHPSVAAALAKNSLNLHGWVYSFETGQVLGYHADERKFIPVTETCCSVPTISRPLSSGETQS